MKIMCLIKMTCPLTDGIAPIPFVPTIHGDQINWLNNKWFDNFFKHSEQYLFKRIDLEEDFHNWTQDYPYQRRTNYNLVLLFDNEEELNVWADNCRLTDPQLIADQETWKTAHGITLIYEYYSLSPTTGPDPIM